MRQLLFPFLLFCLLFSSCTQENPVEKEYENIGHSSSKISGVSVFVLDSNASALNWIVARPDGKSIKGTLHPTIGSLLVEKERILAGFWEGNSFDGTDIVSSPGLDLSQLVRTLLDSNRKLRSSVGKKYHFELAQIGRQIIRSDYKVTVEMDSSQSITHIIQGNLQLADSSLSVTLPVFVQLGEKKCEIRGEYKLNYTDFGVNSGPKAHLNVQDFSTPVQVKYRLVFNLRK